MSDMAPIEKPGAQVSVSERGGMEAIGASERLTAQRRAPEDSAFPREGSENAERAMLRDIDATLARIEDEIARQREVMDDLYARIRQPAA